jgi:putrescine aminotransferase
MTFAKGITGGYQPLGGVAVSDKVADVLTSGGGEFTHGYTYSGHPVACAAGIATLEVLQNQNIIETVSTTIAPYFEKRMRELADHPIVGEVRTTGMLAALELVRDKQSRTRLAANAGATCYCRDTAIQNGLMIRAVNDSIICAPPFICSADEIDILIERLLKALDLTAAQYGVNA